MPTFTPSKSLSQAPSLQPSIEPSFTPTGTPSFPPTDLPTLAPTTVPSETPITSVIPTVFPSNAPTAHPLFSPSMKPTTFNPTLKPSSAPSPFVGIPQQVLFDVTQGISGINSTQFKSPLRQNVFRDSVAKSFGVKTLNRNNVTITSIKDKAQRRQLSPSYNTWTLQDSGISVAYSVSFFAELAGFSDPTTAFNAVSSSLEAAVNSGNFTKTLAAAAASMGDPILQAAVASSIDTPVALNPSRTPTPAPSIAPTGVASESSDDAALSDGAIAGIAIGCIVGFCLIAFTIWYFMSNSGNKTYTRSPTRDESTGRDIEFTNAHAVEIGTKTI